MWSKLKHALFVSAMFVFGTAFVLGVLSIDIDNGLNLAGLITSSMTLSPTQTRLVTVGSVLLMLVAQTLFIALIVVLQRWLDRIGRH